MGTVAGGDKKQGIHPMACMEHECSDCGHVWFDNSTVRTCPVCGERGSNLFDEEGDDR
jgi:rubrerythrin